MKTIQKTNKNPIKQNFLCSNLPLVFGLLYFFFAVMSYIAMKSELKKKAEISLEVSYLNSRDNKDMEDTKCLNLVDA